MKNILFIFIAFAFSYNASLAQTNNIHVSIVQNKLVIEPSNYEVVSYELYLLPKGEDIKGPFAVKGDISHFKEAVNAINHARPGDKVYYENIKVREKGTNNIVSAPNYSTVLK